MTRILCWNIDNFSAATLDDGRGGNDPVYGLSNSTASEGRRYHILDNLTLGDPDTPGQAAYPDIIVIIELVVTGGANRGHLVTGPGQQGALLLLAELRQLTGNDEWMLVPPVSTSGNALLSVAAFYDSANYAFTGPWSWPGGAGPSFDPALGAALVRANYPNGLNGAMPLDRVVPAGLPNAGELERQCAPATGFTDHAPPHAAFAFGANERVPCWFSFAQTDYTVVPPTVQRRLSLFVIHGPASDAAAAAFLTNLANVAEIASAPGQDEVKLVLGDFNVNLLQPQPAFTRAAAYDGLAAAGFALGLDRPALAPPIADPSGYRGYFGTHIRGLTAATYWFISANAADYYPGFGYIGSAANARTKYSYDNILASFGNDDAGAPCGALAHMTILNGLVACPYALVAPPANNAPMGHFKAPIRMNSALFANPAAVLTNAATAALRQVAFRQWDNYGCIRSTSDHFAVVADV